MIRLLIVLFLSLSYMIFAVEFVVSGYIYDLDIADIDADGDLDVIVGNIITDDPDSINFLINNGSGEFTLLTQQIDGGAYLKTEDLDGDSLVDILSRESSNYMPKYYKNLGNLQFGEADTILLEYSHVWQECKTADFEGDGDIDIAFDRCGSDGECHILINDGEGNFDEQFGFLSDDGIGDFYVGDINQDNYVDILITSSNEPYLYLNNDFEFFPVSIDNMHWSDCWLIDMNQDSYIDIVLSEDIPSLTKIFFNNGLGEFNNSHIIAMPPYSIIMDISDYNNDGFPDFAVQMGYNPYVYICFNENNSSLSDPVMYYFGTVYSFIVSSADLDGNGFNDLVVTGYHVNRDYYGISVLFNDGSGNFLENPQVDAQDEIIFPELIQLYNYPNPFDLSGSSRRKGMTILYQIPLKFNITSMFIYNVKGQIIKKLNIDTNTTKGEIFWNGTNQYNEFVPTGVYFYGVSSCELTKYNKMLLIN